MKCREIVGFWQNGQLPAEEALRLLAIAYRSEVDAEPAHHALLQTIVQQKEELLRQRAAIDEKNRHLQQLERRIAGLKKSERQLAAALERRSCNP
jgi:polyhydroxyalkanoate synthesis regulator phasin